MFLVAKIYIDIHILLINYFLLLINIHIVIHKGPEIDPKNNIQVTGVPIFAVLAVFYAVKTLKTKQKSKMNIEGSFFKFWFIFCSFSIFVLFLGF